MTNQADTFFKRVTSKGFLIFLISTAIALFVGTSVAPTWTLERTTLDVQINAVGQPYYMYKKKPIIITHAEPAEEAILTTQSLARLSAEKSDPAITTEIIKETKDGEITYYQNTAKRHWGAWSLLPAITAILMCFVIKEPLTALGSGIVAGSFILGRYDLSKVLIDNIASAGTAKIIVLYLLLLGGLLGIWSKTGAAQAFADTMTRHLVKGPRSAKLVAWILGVVFHQGGTMSTVLVGTTVKPLNDAEKVSHEELSYIVDSTASPIASIIPFNAWPGYIQALIFVPGVTWLATESDRILFFMASIPISFYSIFAVLLTLGLSLEIIPDKFINPPLRRAIKRARETGELDGPDAEPLGESSFTSAHQIPKGYKASTWEFAIPISIIIGVSMGTFVTMGSPQVVWGFGLAIMAAFFTSLFKGMELKNLISGIDEGLKGVIYGTIILVFAITIGAISKETGGASYLVDLLGDQTPYWILPVLLQVLTMVIAFSTGTSWGTYAVAFPLAMPLSYAVAMSSGLDNPYLYTLICFAAVLNGSVFGDQCSPISDTTVLSAMCTGCDLMDHVKTQVYQAAIAAAAAAVLWTGLTLFFT